jgi:hypothetical protein
LSFEADDFKNKKDSFNSMDEYVQHRIPIWGGAWRMWHDSFSILTGLALRSGSEF